MMVNKESIYWTAIGKSICVDFKLNFLFLCSTETVFISFLGINSKKERVNFCIGIRLPEFLLIHSGISIAVVLVLLMFRQPYWWEVMSRAFDIISKLPDPFALKIFLPRLFYSFRLGNENGIFFYFMSFLIESRFFFYTLYSDYSFAFWNSSEIPSTFPHF